MIANQRAIIFDRDNTLTRIDPVASRARAERISTIASTLPDGAVMAHWNTWPGPWPRSQREEPNFWWSFWSSLAARYGFSDAAVRALQTASMPYHTDFAAFPDTVDSIHVLHSQGLRLAVLTNFQLPSVGLTLWNAGIDPGWFTALLSSSMLGMSKPDPRVYLAAAAAIDLPPSACVFVDDLLSNVEGACAVGMRGVWLDRQGLALQTPFERIADLRGLVNLIAGCGEDKQINRADGAQSTQNTTHAPPHLRYKMERINA